MKRISLHLPQNLYEELKALARKRCISFAELVRVFLAEKLSEIQKK